MKPARLLYRLRFVSRFGKLRQHNNARMAQTRRRLTCRIHVRPDAGQDGQTQAKALALREAWKDEHGDKTYGMLTHIASKLYVISPPKAKKNEHQFSSKIDEKSSENPRKTEPNRRKIEEILLLDAFRRPKPFRGRVGTRSGRARDAPKLAQERSWDAPGAPRAAGRRPRASPGRSQDAPVPVRSDVGVCAMRQAQSDASSERFFVVFVLSRKCSDVRKM